MAFAFAKVAFLLGLACLHAQAQGSTRIVNGTDATQGEVPYQLSLQHEGYHFCGASLVEKDNVQFAVSAAHCLIGVDPNSTSITVVAGELNLKQVSGAEQKRQASRIVVHPKYIRAPLGNDISLLFWESPFEVNENVSIINLPTPEMKEMPKKVNVSGWGRLSFGGPAPDVLQLVAIPVVRDEECKSAWVQEGKEIQESMLCAGTMDGKLSPCHGDSGGPAKDPEHGFLAGIVSFGKACGEPGFPGIFTEVAYFDEWIQSEIAAHQQISSSFQ